MYIGGGMLDYSSARVRVVNYSPNQRDLHALQVMSVPARIQGGNWTMQGLRRSGHVHDEGECQMSIAEFMAEHGLPRGGDDA
jgi:hypothetical protein